jgi:hypothetical protein
VQPGIDECAAYLLDCASLGTNGHWRSANDTPNPWSMTLVVIFLFGIVNFAAHKAVLESGHPMIARIPWMRSDRFGPPSMILEFVLLLATMLFVAQDYQGLAWAYAIYSLCNIASAWALLSGRM